MAVLGLIVNGKIVYRPQIASLDVDAQQGFTPYCPNELPVPNGHVITSQLNEQAKFAKYRIFSKDAHSPNAIWVAGVTNPQLSIVDGRANCDVHWNSHCNVGTEGFELLPGLPSADQYDFFVYKGVEKDMHPYGACYHDLANKISTGLIEWLKDKSVTTVIVGGLATDYCVKTTVFQLAKHFNVIVNLGACAAITEDGRANAIKEMRMIGAVIVENSIEISNMEYYL